MIKIDLYKDDCLEKLSKIKNLKPVYLNWSDGGGAEVYRINYDIFILFEIPQYGGEPSYIQTYNIKNISKMIEKIKSWT